MASSFTDLLKMCLLQFKHDFFLLFDFQTLWKQWEELSKTKTNNGNTLREKQYVLINDQNVFANVHVWATVCVFLQPTVPM